MARILRDKVMKVSPDALFRAITEFENYPKFLPEVVDVKRLSPAKGAKQKVQFELEVVKRFQYVLEFKIEGKEKVEWKLIESNFFKTNEGQWNLKAKGKKETEVHYELEVGFGFLVPGFISKKLTEVSLPKMLESFESQAQSLE